MSQDLVALLKRVPLFASLRDEVLAGLAPHLRRRTFRRGTMIFHKDQAGDALYIIESGQVRVFLPSESGEELDIDLLGPGDVFGDMAILDGRPRSASIDTRTDVVTHVLDHDEFQRHLRATPELATAVIEFLSIRLRHVMEYAETLASFDIPGRLARQLLDLADRYGRKVEGDGVEIGLDLTQTELARMVGATRERVNRALASFRAQGLIDVRGKRITILNPKGLSGRIY
jgi:CRP/FNR family transcriptional regulator